MSVIDTLVAFIGRTEESIVTEPTAERPECGTYAAYQWHLKLREETCDPCREASNRYMAAWRTRNPYYADRQKVTSMVRRRRALNRLARLHPIEFEVLYTEERMSESAKRLRSESARVGAPDNGARDTVR